MDISSLLLTAGLSAAAITVLFFIAKLTGNKQITDMSMFDHITSITIGSIAAEMTTAEHPDFLDPLLAMLVFALFALLIYFCSIKSAKLRRFLSGKSMLLFKNDTLYRNNLSAARMPLAEFLEQCRVAGYFNLSEIQEAYIESNGRISIFPRPQNRPATPEDMSIEPPQQSPALNVVLDGQALAGNLALVGRDEAWLNKQLAAQGFKLSEVFLATCTAQQELSVFNCEDRPRKKDPFQ